MSSLRHFDNCRIDYTGLRNGFRTVVENPGKVLQREAQETVSSACRVSAKASRIPGRSLRLWNLPARSISINPADSKLLHMVRKSRGRDRQRRQRLRAAERTRCLGDAFQEFESTRIGKRLQNCRTACAREARRFRRCHRGRICYRHRCTPVHWMQS